MKLSASQWISWLGATAAAAVAACFFLVGFFFTKAEGQSLERRVDYIDSTSDKKVSELKHDIVERLERIENKIDRIR